MMPLQIPDVELSEFARLPDDVKREVRGWLRSLKEVVDLRGQGLNVGKAVPKLAARMGVSVQTTYRRIAQFEDTGWRGLVNWARVPGRHGLPPAFIDEVKRRLANNQRGAKQAWIDLLNDWRQWRDGDESKRIPGYEHCPPADRETGIPAGWTYANLSPKRIGLTQYELKNIRVGAAAAENLGPMVLTSRVGGWPRKWIMFDDVRHDRFVRFKGKPCRVDELGALDVFSGNRFRFGTQPRSRNADNSENGLRLSAMRFLTAAVLYHDGYSRRGTCMMGEHGTALIEDLVREILREHCPEIVVRDGGITGEEQAALGLYAGTGRGNFRFKAPLESLHNLLHNRQASLPGQTGRNLDNRPEQLAGGDLRLVTNKETGETTVRKPGLLAYDQQVAALATVLSPSRAALLQFPLHDYFAQFLPLNQAVWDAINARGEWPGVFDHKLEGWSECGHVVVELRDADRWLLPVEQSALAPAKLDALIRLSEVDGSYTRQRNLSPREVWRASEAGDIKRLPAELVGEMLARDLAQGHAEGAVREEKVDGAYFRFEAETLAAGEMVFESRVKLTGAGWRELRDGERYLCYLNPMCASELFVHDARGGFLGVAARVSRVERPGAFDDTTALQREFGKKLHREAELRAELKKFTAPDTRARMAMHENNANLIEEELASLAEDQSQRREEQREAAQLLGD